MHVILQLLKILLTHKNKTKPNNPPEKMTEMPWNGTRLLSQSSISMVESLSLLRSALGVKGTLTGLVPFQLCSTVLEDFYQWGLKKFLTAKKFWNLNFCWVQHRDEQFLLLATNIISELSLLKPYFLSKQRYLLFSSKQNQVLRLVIPITCLPFPTDP